MAPPHRLCIEHVKVVGRDDFLEGATTAIVPAKEVDFVANQVGCVPSEAFGWTAANRRLCPAESLGVEDVEVLEMLVAGVAAEEVELGAEHGHGVGVASHGDGAGDLGRDPGHGVEVEDVDVVEALFAVVPSEHVQLSAYT